jgi:hypothetical protein
VSAEQEIGDLDASLAKDGQPITLQRLTLAGSEQIPFGVDAMAFVRGDQPNELTQTVTQKDVTVIMSPTEINRSGWPGATPAPAGAGDKRIPRKPDRIITKRGQLTVQTAAGIYIGDTLVRINIRARGES